VQLYAEFLEKPSLDPGPYDPDMLINTRLEKTLTPPHIADVQDLVARWDLSDMSDAGVEERITELAWLTTLLTGATSRPGYPQRIDFFLVSNPVCYIADKTDAHPHVLPLLAVVHAPPVAREPPHPAAKLPPHRLPDPSRARPPPHFPRGSDELPAPADRRGALRKGRKARGAR